MNLLFAAEAVPEVSFTDSASWILNNVWLLPAIMGASFVIILFFGKRMPKGGSEVGVAAVGLCFLLALVAGVSWFDHRDNFDEAEAQRATELHHDESEGVEGEEGGGEHAEEPGEEAASADWFEYEPGVAGADGSLVLTAAADEGSDEGSGEAAGEGHSEEEEHPSIAIQRTTTWFTIGGQDYTVGILVDGPTVMMLFVVTIISLLVHIYSTDYVAGDRRYTHFFAFLSLFTGSMLMLVMSSSTVQFITSWELVGVCSFALIGHWWEEQPNSDAALKAFLTNRVGDIGLLVGMTILFWTAGGTFDILEINELAVAGDISHTALLAAALCLLAAVMSKSGQFILHTWLPDAMAGPTPVSALIHAATMVVAGIFMVARLYPVFFEGLSISGSSINALALVGAVTLLFGGLLAFVQDDIKKVLAYSTVSQLGYMVMALGVGAYTAALFHLFTHAFFKACLFLGSGSVSHAVHSFDMKKDMGGMRKWMPHTYRTFLIASIALAGIPPLAGFWSKDEILAGTGGWDLFGGTGGNGSYTLMLLMGMLGAALTAAYMTRVVYLTFFGEFRGHGTPHESGPRIVVPLYILAVFAVFAGLFNLPEGFQLVPESWTLRFEHYAEPVSAAFPAISHATPSWSLAIFSTLVALGGFAIAYNYYFVRVANRSKADNVSYTELPDGLVASNSTARAGHHLLVEKYYFDHLYTDTIVAAVKGPVADGVNWSNKHLIDAVVDTTGRTAVKVGDAVYNNFDQPIVDGAVNLTGVVSNETGSELRKFQTGKVQHYGGYLFAGAAILAGIFIIVII
ncbi:MAG: NADH-quinone oxidoreductase subunit L [Acidimicrobiia bacterium]|nr:NADH-quinone oxidoreductase subunit L [Acidimicrobiia bacterium]